MYQWSEGRRKLLTVANIKTDIRAIMFCLPSPARKPFMLNCLPFICCPNNMRCLPRHIPAIRFTLAILKIEHIDIIDIDTRVQVSTLRSWTYCCHIRTAVGPDGNIQGPICNTNIPMKIFFGHLARDFKFQSDPLFRTSFKCKIRFCQFGDFACQTLAAPAWLYHRAPHQKDLSWTNLILQPRDYFAILLFCVYNFMTFLLFSSMHIANQTNSNYKWWIIF